MKVELVRFTPDPDGICGIAAAKCTNTSQTIKALKGALASGHESVLEHAVFTFEIEGISRVTLAQLTRHRLASYSVRSQRYCGVDIGMVIPDGLANAELLDDIVAARKAVDKAFRHAVDLGVPEEDARYLTMQGGTTGLIMTANARELQHFFAMRCCNRAQWEIRELADRMLELCRRAAPVIFAKAGAACMRGEPCPEGKRSCGKPRV